MAGHPGAVRGRAGRSGDPGRSPGHPSHERPWLPDGGLRATVRRHLGGPPPRRRRLPGRARHLDGERARPRQHGGSAAGHGALPAPVRGPARVATGGPGGRRLAGGAEPAGLSLRSAAVAGGWAQSFTALLIFRPAVWTVPMTSFASPRFCCRLPSDTSWLLPRARPVASRTLPTALSFIPSALLRVPDAIPQLLPLPRAPDISLVGFPCSDPANAGSQRDRRSSSRRRVAAASSTWRASFGSRSTTDRKSRAHRTMSRVSLVVVTVAVRWPRERNASSPKKSPVPRSPIRRPRLLTRSAPAMITNRSWSVSPSRTTSFPGGRSTSVAAWISARMPTLDTEPNIGTASK